MGPRRQNSSAARDFSRSETEDARRRFRAVGSPPAGFFFFDMKCRQCTFLSILSCAASCRAGCRASCTAQPASRPAGCGEETRDAPRHAWVTSSNPCASFPVLFLERRGFPRPLDAAEIRALRRENTLISKSRKTGFKTIYSLTSSFTIIWKTEIKLEASVAGRNNDKQLCKVSR